MKVVKCSLPLVNRRGDNRLTLLQMLSTNNAIFFILYKRPTKYSIILKSLFAAGDFFKRIRGYFGEKLLLLDRFMRDHKLINEKSELKIKRAF